LFFTLNWFALFIKQIKLEGQKTQGLFSCSGYLHFTKLELQKAKSEDILPDVIIYFAHYKNKIDSNSCKKKKEKRIIHSKDISPPLKHMKMPHQVCCPVMG